MWCRRPLRTFAVTLHLDGRHPYLQSTDLDFETRDVVVTVAARDWVHAEKVALSVASLPKHWRRSVSAMKRAEPDNA